MGDFSICFSEHLTGHPIYLYGGNHPENVDPAHGTTIATKYIITCNGGKVIVNLCFEIKGAVSE